MDTHTPLTQPGRLLLSMCLGMVGRIGCSTEHRYYWFSITLEFYLRIERFITSFSKVWYNSTAVCRFTPFQYWGSIAKPYSRFPHTIKWVAAGKTYFFSVFRIQSMANWENRSALQRSALRYAHLCSSRLYFYMTENWKIIDW